MVNLKPKPSAKLKKETYFCGTSQRGAKGFLIADRRFLIAEILLKSLIENQRSLIVLTEIIPKEPGRVMLPRENK